jgi:tRNA (cytidine/uridine-2'-O-)-methyltransferase
MIDCALFEPDIPQNAGAILRLGACFNVPVHIIHPAGFTLSDRNFKRAGMDYLSRADCSEHADWSAFEDWRRTPGGGLLCHPWPGASFRLPVSGQRRAAPRAESAGLPEHARDVADAVLRIEISSGDRASMSRHRIDRGVRGAPANRPAPAMNSGGVGGGCLSAILAFIRSLTIKNDESLTLWMLVHLCPLQNR